jgi:hypothetical protein
VASGLSVRGLQTAIISDQGSRSVVATAVGRDVKGKLSPLLYVAGIGLSFASRWAAVAIYASVALMWLIPDRRLDGNWAGTGGAEVAGARGAAGL